MKYTPAWARLAPRSISSLLTDSPEVRTFSTPLSIGDSSDPGVVKVVVDQFSRALYFSRSAIPGSKSAISGDKARATGGPSPYQRHLGLYAFRAEFLETFIALPGNTLLAWEDLEQLKVLGAGFTIAVAQVANATAPDVNTEHDLQVLRQLLAARSGV